MALPEYRNLTERELVYADHYAETGNMAGLRRMQELSASRELGGQRITNHRTRMTDAGVMPYERDNE